MSFLERKAEPYELQYIKILKEIFKHGYRQLNERTNVETLRIPHAVITVNLQNEFPILKSKYVNWKAAAKEILWIMQKQSNNINDLDSKIWDQWADEEGSIGKAYGYQIAKPVTIDGVTYPSQIHYILSKLDTDSSDRRCVVDMWNVDELDEMNLVPCCYSSMWNIIDGKLNCMLVQRSADFLVGVPFNTTQYAILTHLLAWHLGVEPGRLTHVMSDCHIYCYESHIAGGHKMIDNFERCDELFYLSVEHLEDIAAHGVKSLAKELSVIKSEPRFEINSDGCFFTISIDEISVEDYYYMEKIKFDVAV